MSAGDRSRVDLYARGRRDRATAAGGAGSFQQIDPRGQLRHFASIDLAVLFRSGRKNKGISNCLTGRTLGSPGGVATRFGSVGGRLAAACR
jgi:hypothetical protein